MSAITADGVEVIPGQKWRYLANERRTVKILTASDDGTAVAWNVEAGAFEPLKIERMHNWAGGWELVGKAP